MDLPAPVANTIQPPDMMKSLNMMSGMLDLQKSRQALQIGQQNLAQQQIETQKQQQLQGFFKNIKFGEHLSSDGTIDLGSVMGSDDFDKLDIAKPAAIETLQNIKQKQLQAKQSLATLDRGTLSDMADGLGTLSTDPDVLNDTDKGRGMVMDYYANFGSLSPQNKRIADTFGQVVKHAPKGQLGDAVKAQSLLGTSALSQIPASALQPVTLPDGTMGFKDPRTGQVTAGGEAPRAPGPPMSPDAQRHNIPAPVLAGQQARQVQTGNADVDRSNEVSGMQQASSAAIPLTSRIDELADEISASKIAGSVTQGLRHLGFSDIDAARTQLKKDLGQVKGLAIAKSGSDARAATILEGYPDDTTPPTTIHAAMDYIRGTARQNLNRGKNLMRAQQADPQGLRGFQASDNVISNQTNPLQHEYLSLPPEKRAGFLKRNFSSKDAAQAFLDETKALKQHSKVFD